MSMFMSVLVLLFGVASGLTRQYIFQSKAVNWWDAQSYCRQNFKDLATITNAEENDRLYAVPQNRNNTWIGSFKGDHWYWSDETQSNYFPMVIISNLTWGCVDIEQTDWQLRECAQYKPFVCYVFLVLVNEKMTWEEAFEYCKVNYTGLASLAFDSQDLAAETESNQSQTDSMWAALRFLDGKWFWLSQGELGNEVLPTCPAPPYRCGARNIKTHIWENRDCNEKLNFLCYY